MSTRHYQQELQNLRELAVEFSKAHPALAPMLSGQTPDPDVERLLEGVAFLTGLLREKLDDEFPEILHGLIDLIFPHYLRPIPSSTLIAFTPKPNLKETLTVPAGAQIGSVPVDGTSCIFKTCFSLEVHPLKIVSAEFVQSPGTPARIRLVLELRGIPLEKWAARTLRFYLGGGYPEATDLYFLLNRQVSRIVLKPVTGAAPAELPPGSLTPVGFAREDALLSYPAQSFPGYRILQEYLILPEKFLFLDLKNMDRWKERGTGSAFEILFELAKPPAVVPRIKPESFMLFVTPATNLFSHEADPLTVNHRQAEYRIRPGGRSGIEVYSVEKVTGLVQGTVDHKEYVPFQFFGKHEKEKPIYSISRRKSPVTQNLELYLSLTYPSDAEIAKQEMLSIQLTCTNGSIPEKLQLGDISQPTSTSPSLMDFRNILPPTAPIQPPIGSNVLWNFLSHIALNYLSVASLENVKELLQIYIFPEGRDRTKIAANMKRVEGINGLQVQPASRLVSGLMMRGNEIRMKVRQDHFASTGDMFLFCSILDYFFAVYSSLNSFTRFFVEETLTGEIYSWPPRIGERFLA
ncbi:MAG: type VI secretion system baseplate subunit TssF [Deltaproteobacteria bacterium HGW-Deltaproteobacteria-15]|jgi:type VI secretion system protein ImpG|nr:MAG: type VI secretion system baseplate subunit TssF [Deltaproteobacteria bacterium HGW-Deltaproteobacteria-15]